MLVPLSWLKQYVPIKLPLPKLCERLTEVGIGVENVHKTEEDTILELEITPNRSDLLSLVGVAREVAAIQKTSVKIPRATIPQTSKTKKKLPINIKLDFRLSPRVSAHIIDGIKVKESPLWLQERLTSIGLRSINNIVDISNFVMFELGNPLHAFDYDQIKGHTMTVTQATGGEKFTTVDNISYKLPKGANVIVDKERIIDLCGIKGGLNSAITSKTKTVLLWVAVDDGPNIRKTSQALGLRSQASAIYERGVNRGGTVDALARATSLISKLAGGTVASDLIDLKKGQFAPWQASLSLERLESILGVSIDEKKVLQILTLLNLSPQKSGKLIQTTIPTYRNDLQIEEDLVEEVARLYGYNRLPQTLPKGEGLRTKIPYQSQFDLELMFKRLMASFGFSEANTLSLVSREEAKLTAINDEESIFVANPVSREFELLRPSLLINLLKAVPKNLKHQERIKLFELGKIYRKDGKTGFEKRSLAAVFYPAGYFDMKGVVESYFEALSLPIRFTTSDPPATFHKQKSADIFGGKERVGFVGEVSKRVLQVLGIEKSLAILEVDIDLVLSVLPKGKIYQPIPKYPSLIEDLSIVVNKEVLTGELMETIKSVNPLIVKVEFMDLFENTRTFKVAYQHRERNVAGVEVATIRRQILTHLKKKFNAELKG